MAKMKRRAIYYDTETTGIRPEKERLIELAAYDATLDKSYVTFINPGMPIPKESTDITGITDEMVKDAPTFAEIAPQFFDFCKDGGVLIAHNNDSFDKRFLEEECKRNQLTLPNFEYVDTLKWSRKYRPDLPRHSLQYLREVYGIEKNNAHRALDDVMMMHQIFSIMIGDLTIDQVIECMSQSADEVLQMPFGKHRGKHLSKLPKGYLSWLGQSGALEKPENESLKASLSKLGLLSV